MQTTDTTRYDAATLIAFATKLYRSAGMEGEKAETTARLQVEADLMGHTTHGLALAGRYLDELAAGEMIGEGEPEVVSDRGACIVWRGRQLPGLWLTDKAIDLAMARAPTYGTVTAVISSSHHIGCLAVYLPKVTAAGFMVTIMCSDPTKASVAPHGGAKPVFTPNPMAVGIPTEGDPIMIDISCSITTNNMLIRLAREGKKLPEKWLIDAEGNLTDDPAVWRNGGALLLSGGLDHGQKGYGWILMLEALTQGLSGFGRADGPNNSMSASIYIQIVDPSAFSGQDAFKRQTSHMAEACRATPPLAGIEKVRLPGDSAMRIRRESVKHGVVLHPGTLESLAAHAARHGLDLPQPKL